jgi:uncharacterized protein DUF3489
MAKPNKSNSQTRTQTPAPIKRTTKKDQLIKLLSSKAGREIKVISETLGWQHHTTRAALSGLRKAGYDLTAEKAAGGKQARYRINSVPSQAKESSQPNGA